MQRFYHFCIRFLQTTSFILFGLLAVVSFLWTASIENPYEYIIEIKPDNPLGNLLFLCCLFGIFFGIQSLFSHRKRGNGILLILTCLWVFGASFFWIYFSKNGPIADGASVYYAAKRFAVGDFSSISYRDSYFSVYPFQLGLAFFYEMVFRLVRNDNFHILQGINALCLVLCTISQYHLCGRFFREKRAQIYTLLFTGFCAPLLMYGAFVYGEIPSITCTLFGTWMLLLFLEGQGQFFSETVKSFSPFFRALFGILAVISLSFGVLVRKNSLVFLMALGITVVLWLLHNKSRFSGRTFALYAAYFILLFSLSVEILPLVQNRYAARSGASINPGVPAISYLAMGLSETEVGPGFYSGYNFETFTNAADYDPKAAAEISLEDYRERVSYFVENPGYSLRFFCKKFCAEWIDTGWAVFPATYNSLGERPPFLESLFSGPLHAPFKGYINGYQMALYLASAAATLSLFRRRKEQDIFVYLFPLTAFGGALLFLIWETSGRYILPYAVFMLPYGGYGAQKLIEKVVGFFSAALKGSAKKTP